VQETKGNACRRLSVYTSSKALFKRDHPALPKIVAMKLFLRPIFCAFSALRSIGLFSLGNAGKGGVSRSLIGGVGEMCSL
jgi:hypothetical protein